VQSDNSEPGDVLRIIELIMAQPRPSQGELPGRQVPAGSVSLMQHRR
jgi:hypothetical protein